MGSSVQIFESGKYERANFAENELSSTTMCGITVFKLFLLSWLFYSGPINLSRGGLSAYFELNPRLYTLIFFFKSAIKCIPSGI